jgi:hypothetical protein
MSRLALGTMNFAELTGDSASFGIKDLSARLKTALLVIERIDYPKVGDVLKVGGVARDEGLQL